MKSIGDIDLYKELAYSVPQTLGDRGLLSYGQRGDRSQSGWLRGSFAVGEELADVKITYPRLLKTTVSENTLLLEYKGEYVPILQSDLPIKTEDSREIEVDKNLLDLFLNALDRSREAKKALRNFLQLTQNDDVRIRNKEYREQLPEELKNLQTECLDSLKELMSIMLDNHLCEVDVTFLSNEGMDEFIDLLGLLSPEELMAFMDNAMEEIDKFYEARDGIGAGLSDMWTKSKDLIVFLQRTSSALLESHRDKLIGNAVERVFHGYQVIQNAKNQNVLEHLNINMLA